MLPNRCAQDRTSLLVMCSMANLGVKPLTVAIQKRSIQPAAHLGLEIALKGTHVDDEYKSQRAQRTQKSAGVSSSQLSTSEITYAPHMGLRRQCLKRRSIQ